ncbi:Ig-like domain-containing protein [Herbiconiux sp. KACC 21604]|uniref:Ig-like domain-containing protein n=1 Tax=unclassified Herbiconiux TaxID=2618217 RepID=UPI0014912BB4|nr:Ig-like domain-containing protein [Herbiconiux sp. SALV-R1]QJU53992.1 hypothetical protein HL652_10390 [Herbiconiux sp. SALV-R1]WPO85021.1 Ig-like domain-containing protein [Herbiconiux sp. KACC 21604]
MSESRNEWGRTPSLPSDGATGRSRGRAGARTRTLAATATGIALGALLLVGGGLGATSAAATVAPAASVEPTTTPAPAAATESPAPTESPTPAPAPTEAPRPVESPPPSTPPTDPGTPTPPPADAVPPVIDSPAAGELLDGSVRASGEATPGATVQVVLAGASEPFCIVDVPASGSWSCDIDGLESSSSTTLRAVELAGTSTAESRVQVRVLTAPVVAGGPRGPLTNAVVLGTAHPGALVTATTGEFACDATADASGAWSCPLDPAITDGPYSVTATQSTSWSDGASSPRSSAVDIEVDVTVPAAPVVLAPVADDRLPVTGGVFSGTGETGATVSVFAGAGVLCESAVVDSRWSCTGAPAAPGRYPVAVLQQDAAGNVSVQSRVLAVVFGDRAATSTPRPTPGATASPRPTKGASPAAPAPSSGDDGAAQSPPDGSSPGTPGSGDDGGGAGGDDGGPGGQAPSGASPNGSTSWADGTRFTTALQPVLASGAWWVALVVAALVLLLVALPTRLLAGTVGALTAPGIAPGTDGLPRRRMLARLTGRNRTRLQEYERGPQLALGRPARAALAFAASAALITLSAPVFGEPAYLRLLLAAIAAVALLNAAATILPAVAARRFLGIESRARLEPRLLLVTAGFALVSRLADLEPALVFGLVAALVVAAPAGRAVKGKLAALQVGTLLVVGAVAWVLSSALGGAGGDAAAGDPAAGALGVAAAAASEFATIVVLGAFGAASVSLLPFGGSAGRRILDWSPLVWVALTLAAFGGLALAFAPALVASAQAGGLAGPVAAVVGFAVVSVSAWAWARFVAPEAETETEPEPGAGVHTHDGNGR